MKLTRQAAWLWVVTLLFSSLAFGTAAVSGKLVNPNTTGPIIGGYAQFDLINCGGNFPQVAGASIETTQRFLLAADGTWSGTLYRNDEIFCNSQATSEWRLTYFVSSLQVGPQRNFVCSQATCIFDGVGGLTPINSNPAPPAPQPPATGSRTFLCSFILSASTWTCTHNMATQFVDTEFFDSNFKQIFPDSNTATDANTVTATFLQPQAGYALVINSGNFTPTTLNPNYLISNPTADQAVTGDHALAVGGSLSAKRINKVLQVDGVNYANIAAAVAEAGTTNATIINILSTYPGTDCPPIQVNIVFHDYRAGGRIGTGTSSFICTQNVIQYNTKTAGLTDVMLRPEMTRSSVDAAGSINTAYFLTHLNNATVTGGVVNGVSTEGQVNGTLSGTLSFLEGNESVATVTSTGGAISTAIGVQGYVFNTLGSTTAITNAYGVWGRGCNGTIAGVAPFNCYGGFFSRQLGAGSVRNYSFGSEGLSLFLYDPNQGIGGFDCEDTDHTLHRCFYIGSDHSTNLQAINATGLFLVSSDNQSRVRIQSSGLGTITGIYPTTAGNHPVGLAGNPYSGIYIGASATNNYFIQQANTPSAPVAVQISDPGIATVGMGLKIASGTAVMTTAAITAGNCGATVIVAATGVVTTDSISWSFNAAPAGSNAGLVSWPTGNNVNFAYCPNTAETPAAATINWRVTR